MKFVLVTMLSFYVLAAANAQASSESGAAAQKQEEKKADKKVEAPAAQQGSYSDLLPSTTTELPSGDTTSPEAEAQKIKDSRWLDQKQLQQKQNESAKAKGKSSVTWTATCTDKTGKSLSAGDTGYESCVQQVCEDSKTSGQPTTQGETNPDKKVQGKGSGSVGAGFKINFP